MALTLGARIENYSGAIGSYEAIPAMHGSILEITKRVISRRPDTFFDFAAQTSFTDEIAIPSTLGIDAIRYPSQKNYMCRFLPPELYFRAVKSTSIYLATTTDPVWTYHDSKLKVFPITGDAVGKAELITADQAIAASDLTITKFPDYLLEPWAKKCACSILSAKIHTEITALKALALTALTINTTFPADELTNAIGIQIKPSFLPTGGSALAPLASLATYLDAIGTYTDTEWDETLASSKANEVQARIQDYLSRLDGQLKDWNAKMTEYQASDGRYSMALQRYQLEIGNLVTKHQSDVQDYGSKSQVYMQTLQALINQYQMVMASYEQDMVNLGV